MGQIVSYNQVKANLTVFNYCKVQIIPKLMKELRSLIGYLNFFRLCVLGLSILLNPITEKLKKKEVIWSHNYSEAINRIVKKINEHQSLYIPSSNRTFELYTDASDQGISGILLQENRFCRIFSRKLKDTESRYSMV